MTALLADAGFSLLEEIEELRPAVEVDESPTGWLAAIDKDTWWVLVEMHALLVEGPARLGEVEWSAQLQDLAGLLEGLHKRAEKAFDAVLAAVDPPPRPARHPALPATRVYIDHSGV
jgi:hypothetical protein